MNSQDFPDISIVIATLGGSTLKLTLDCINNSSILPKEILICIPPAERANVAHFKNDRVKVLVTQSRGQVAQRAEGFRNAHSNVVLQMDDDVAFSATSIQTLMQYLLGLGPGHVIGPVFCSDVNHQPIFRFDLGLKGFLKNAYFTVIAGLPWGLKRMGSYSKTTCAISVDPKFAEKPLHPAQWLAGGFVLGFKQDLVFDNFYPFSGKAYSEDLLHASRRIEKGIKHMVATEVMVSTQPQSNKISWNELQRELTARRAVAKHLGVNKVRLAFFIAAERLKRAAKAITKADL